jgi:hypothetical protein
MTDRSNQENRKKAETNEPVQTHTEKQDNQNKREIKKDIDQVDKEEGNDNPGETGGDFSDNFPDLQKGPSNSR